MGLPTNYSSLDVASSTVTDAPSAPAAPTPGSTVRPVSATDHADPDEVDISDHYYEPKRGAPLTPEPNISEEQLRLMMTSFERGNNTPGGMSPAPDGMQEDPMMQMMSQLMAGTGLPQGSMPPFPGMPGAAPHVARSNPSTNLWRLLHALVALGLGLYIVILTPFSGSRIDRERAALSGTSPADPLIAASQPEMETDLEHRKRLFFWTFATAESLLLTTRFFLLKKSPVPTGVVGTVLGFLPQPYKNYVEIVHRYGQIFTTVRADILACIFVLGVVSWIKG